MMDFPAYVPAAVREYIKTRIEGDPWEPMGWQETLASAERQLAKIEGEINAKTQRGEHEYLPSLRIERDKALAHRDTLALDVDCLRRLADDARMREAFTLLTSEFTDDKQWQGFIYAAWAARMDFEKYRERLKRAAELKGQIADAAEQLATLIRQFSETGMNGPGEFYSIPELLDQTDNHELQDHNLTMWRSMRPHVLGEVPSLGDPETYLSEIVVTDQEDTIIVNKLDDLSKEPTNPSATPALPLSITRVLVEGKVNIDPKEELRNMVRYAWKVAPDFPALLDTVAKAGRAFKPSESGMIGAAIKSRQSSLKTQYVRAFGNLLTDVHRFELTMRTMQAMACVANVVINLPDVDVTYDDVRKALAKGSGERRKTQAKKSGRVFQKGGKLK